jgi:hypothetical protein
MADPKTYDEQWTKKVQPFADAVGKSLEEVSTALAAEVGESGTQALEALALEEFTPFESLKQALAGLNIPPAILRKNIGLLREVKKSAAPTDLTTMTRYAAVLPSIPDDTSFVESLKIGGVLKVGVTEIVSAVKAALADRVKFYDLPSILKDRMESTAETLEEPCSSDYYELRKMVLKRSYSEVLSALGIEGSSFITESGKAKFLAKLEQYLWDSVQGFHEVLVGWNKSWIDTAGNPGVLATTIASVVSGGGAGLPAGMMQPPDTAHLRDAAEATIMTINKVFAGHGIPLVRALAYEAQKIKEVVENPKLPMLVGAENRERMLKILGVDVAGDYVRLERNLVQYIVAIMEYPKTTQDQSEIIYLNAMLQLGSSIPWSKLVEVKTGHGGKAQRF